MITLKVIEKYGECLKTLFECSLSDLNYSNIVNFLNALKPFYPDTELFVMITIKSV